MIWQLNMRLQSQKQVKIWISESWLCTFSVKGFNIIVNTGVCEQLQANVWINIQWYLPLLWICHIFFATGDLITCQSLKNFYMLGVELLICGDEMTLKLPCCQKARIFSSCDWLLREVAASDWLLARCWKLGALWLADHNLPRSTDRSYWSRPGLPVSWCQLQCSDLIENWIYKREISFNNKHGGCKR